MNPNDPPLKQLEESLWRDPLDDATWRVYADLLESQGDPTAGFVRTGLESEGSQTYDATFKPWAGLPQAKIHWRHKGRFRPEALDPLPFRGLSVKIEAPSPEAQQELAQLLAKLPELPRLLVFLQRLELQSCAELESSLVEALARLPLQQLTVDSWGHRGEAKLSLEKLPAVQHLDLTRLRPAHKLSGRRELPLRTLAFQVGGRKLSFLAALPHLERLGLRLDHLTDLAGLAECARLHTLKLDGSRLKKGSLEVIARLPLRRLELDGIAVDDLGPLSQLATLETFCMSYTDARPDLSPLSELPHLRRVELDHCKGGLDVAPLARLPSLQFLKMHEVWESEGSYAVQQAHPEMELDYYEDVRE